MLRTYTSMMDGSPVVHPSEAVRISAIYARFTGWYDSLMEGIDRALFESGRRWLGAQAHGDVLEVGIGTGRNLGHYGDGGRIIGVDISGAPLGVACRRAHLLGGRAALVPGDAHTLPLLKRSFDRGLQPFAVLDTHASCAIREAARVVRPNGSVTALEHVRSDVPVVRLVHRLLDPVTVRTLGDHLLGEPLDHIADAGLVVETVRQTHRGIVERVRARRAEELPS